MSELKKAIEEITYLSDRFPEKAFKVITENREKAIPYLRKAVEYAFDKRMELEDGYQLHFYALYLLGQFQDKEFFPKIMEFVSMPGDELDFLIGDAVTSGLSDILYNTYDGNLELLKKSIGDRNVDEFVRAAMLDVMGQLFLDGTLAEDEWKAFLKQNIHDGREYDYIYNAIGDVICQCHLVDMLPEIRYMFDHDLLDETHMGKYDSYVDAMFEYRKEDETFCHTPMNAADKLRHWAMFRDERDESEDKMQDGKAFEKMIRAVDLEINKPVSKMKIGRNDPCPCGSGKKYKFCCLNKPKDAIDSIESPEERQKWLMSYPYTGKERIEGRIYLEDYFDPTGIEVDKILYLGLMNRPGLIWKRNVEAEEKRTKEYLYLAFQKCIARMEQEQIESFDEYDEKYSIHYRSGEWINELLRLLEKNNDMQACNEVKKWVK